MREALLPCQPAEEDRVVMRGGRMRGEGFWEEGLDTLQPMRKLRIAYLNDSNRRVGAGGCIGWWWVLVDAWRVVGVGGCMGWYVLVNAWGMVDGG